MLFWLTANEREQQSGGWGGIRTHEGRSAPAGFQDRCLKPLGHPSIMLIVRMISPSNRPSTANSSPHVTTPIGGVDRKRRTGDAGIRTKALKGEKPSDWSNDLCTTRTVTAAVTQGACARLPSNLRIRWLSIGFGVGEISAFAEADPPGSATAALEWQPWKLAPAISAKQS